MSRSGTSARRPATSPGATWSVPVEATARLLAGTRAHDVPVSRLRQQVNACTQNPGTTGQFGCYGNMYDPTLDSSGRIARITALHHS
ncbi:hypothetical protein [Kitasatospora sp. NPDC007106]|uniref:hypothetical protein n=1 Tax=Kitasatospora sp. NPDC007106 TaxID=3156914 RepID=UPI00340FB3FB